MRNVEVNFKSTDKDKAEYWVRVDKFIPPNWVKGEPVRQEVGNKSFLIEANERLVIESAEAQVDMVFDKDQNAAVTRSAYDSRPDDAARARMEEDRQKEIHEKQFGKQHPQNTPTKQVSPPSGSGVAAKSGIAAPGPSTGGKSSNDVKG